MKKNDSHPERHRLTDTRRQGGRQSDKDTGSHKQTDSQRHRQTDRRAQGRALGREGIGSENHHLEKVEEFAKAAEQSQWPLKQPAVSRVPTLLREPARETDRQRDIQRDRGTERTEGKQDDTALEQTARETGRQGSGASQLCVVCVCVYAERLLPSRVHYIH